MSPRSVFDVPEHITAGGASGSMCVQVIHICVFMQVCVCVMTECPAWQFLSVSSGWRPPARVSLPADSLRSPLRSGRLVSDARPPPPRPETHPDTEHVYTSTADSKHRCTQSQISALFHRFLTNQKSSTSVQQETNRFWPCWRRSWRRSAGLRGDSQNLRRCWSRVPQSLSPDWCCGASDPWGRGPWWWRRIRISLLLPVITCSTFLLRVYSLWLGRVCVRVGWQTGATRQTLHLSGDGTDVGVCYHLTHIQKVLYQILNDFFSTNLTEMWQRTTTKPYVPYEAEVPTPEKRPSVSTDPVVFHVFFHSCKEWTLIHDDRWYVQRREMLKEACECCSECSDSTHRHTDQI